jgi:hypothetical protein
MFLRTDPTIHLGCGPLQSHPQRSPLSWVASNNQLVKWDKWAVVLATIHPGSPQIIQGHSEVVNDTSVHEQLKPRHLEAIQQGCQLLQGLAALLAGGPAQPAR